MNRLALIEVGPAERSVTEAVRRELGSLTGGDVELLPALPIPRTAWDPQRRQYAAIEILRGLLGVCPEESGRVLAITECDLFIPVLSFVFGQAQLGGRLAVVSLARLRQEFYGLTPHAATLESRAVTEALHELGHTYGLVHCADPLCAMSLSTDVRQVDRKSKMCASCAGALRAGSGQGGCNYLEMK